MLLERRTFLALLVAGAFLVRLAAVLALRDLEVGPLGPYSQDDVQYNALALEVAQGNGYVNDRGRPTSFRAPGFPLFLAGLYALAGPNYPLAYLSFCLLGALSCLLTYLLARELLPEGPARLAAVLAAVYLPHIYFATVFWSENLFVPCLALG